MVYKTIAITLCKGYNISSYVIINLLWGYIWSAFICAIRGDGQNDRGKENNKKTSIACASLEGTSGISLYDFTL